MDMVNSEDFRANLSHAINNPNSKHVQNIKRKILPLLKIIGSKVKWSPFERKSTLGRHYAHYHTYGLPLLLVQSVQE